MPSGRERGVLGTLDDGALVARFGVDGRVVAAAGLDGRIHVWDASSRQKLAELVGHLGPIHDLAFHPDGETLVSVSADGDVRRWDLARGRTLQLLAGHDAYLVGLAISPDGRAMLTTSADGSLGLWRAEPFWHLSLLARPSRMALWVVAFLGDGERFVTGGDDRALHVGHVDRPEAAEALPATDRILYPAVHPDGERLGVPLDNGLAWVGRDGERTMLRGHRASVSSVAFTADGATVLTSSEDGTVRAMDPAGEVAWQVPGEVGITAVGRVGEALAAGFADGTFGLWSAADGSPLVRAKLHGPVVHLLYEGAALYAATELGDHARLDLGVLDEDYCTLMRALWAEVPVVWSAGRARDREPDPSHACANP